MKVIHLWQDYSPNLFDRTHTLCLANGVDSEVVCQAFIENGAKALLNTYSVRTRSPEESNSQQFFSRLYRFIRRKMDAKRFAALAFERIFVERADVVHCHFGTTAAVLAQHGVLPSVPFVVSFYGADISQSLHDKAVLMAYKVVFEKAALLHVLCDEAKNRLVALGCSPAKIRIANLPIDLSAIPNIGVESTGITRFLIPARFVEKKGHLVLLKAYRRLVDAGFPVSLTCFGYGPVEWLLQAINEFDLNDRVEVIDNHQTGDFMTEYVSQLRKHDVILAPSVRAANGDDEGGPALTLVMAQAAGKPVITSDFPGAERSVRNGCEGRVIASGDVDALCEAMEGLVGAEAEWRRFGEAGRLNVRRDFSEDAYWAELKNWYRY